MATAIGWVLGAVLAVAGGWLLIQLGVWLNAHGKGAVWERLGEMAREAVLYAQQRFGDRPGPERFEIAAEWLCAAAAMLRWKLDPGLVRGLIESALVTAKCFYPTLWGKAPPVADGTARASP